MKDDSFIHQGQATSGGVALSEAINTNVWQSLWQVAGPNRKVFLRGLMWRFLQSAALGLAFSLMILSIRDVAVGDVPDQGKVLLIAALMGLSLLAQIGCSYLANRAIWLTAFELTLNLRLQLLQRLRHLPMQFHLSRHSGNTLAALTDDISLLEAAITEGLPRIVQAFGLPLVVLLWLGWHEPLLGLVMSLSIITALPFLAWANRRMAALGKKRQVLQAEAGSAMIEFVLGQPVIRACNQQNNSAARFRTAIDTFRNISVDMVWQLTPPLVGFAAILLTGIPLTLAYLGVILSDETQPAFLVVVLLAAFSVYLPLLSLTGVLELTRMADASMGRITQILDAPLLPEPQHSKTPVDYELRFENVGFSYPGAEPVLQDVSFTAQKGQLTAIIGASGSGKSTILSLLMRFWDVDTGAVQIGDCDLRDMSSQQISELISIVSQDVYLFEGSIGENIALARPEASGQDIQEAAKAAQIDPFIQTLPKGYETLVGEGGARLSGGERQRIAIARAILKNAPVLLLDEFTSAIDPTGERAILDALSRAMEGRTVISVTHRIATARAADQVVFLRGGQVVQSGRHVDLMDIVDYREFWTNQGKSQRQTHNQR